jgi:23S rRNA pseudouridine2605 synthase
MSPNKRERKPASKRNSGHAKPRRPYKRRKKIPETYQPKELTELSGEMRLSRFMSLAGVASRRTCDEIIESGAVTVNGAVIIAPGTKVTTEDTIILNGQRLSLEEKTYIMLNKPVGYICSAADPNNEQTVYDLVRLPNIRLFSAGRLDLNSEGLLILTNDGDYADKLMHPRYGTEKKYRVRTNKGLTPEEMDAIRNGIYDMGEFLKPKSLKKIKEKEYFFIMAEGKKREIRRLISSTGKKVTQLRRVAIGDLSLGSLPLGKWRTISRNEITQSLA